MTVLKSGISWCDGTLNAWVGCTKVSAGCDRCYAEALVHRLQDNFGHPFSEVRLHLHRLADVRRMKPQVDSRGWHRPFLCFVNSMSDFWHDAVPNEAISTALDAFEAKPDTVFQILTKRPARMGKFLADRYPQGIPRHLWIGVSVEANEVAVRLNFLRRLREKVKGDMVAFASVEPIIGPTDALDFTGIDWAIMGGESGGGARIMHRSWMDAAIGRAREAGAAIWLKQHGQIASHPNLVEVPRDVRRKGNVASFAWLIENGWEAIPEEKGGATIDRVTFRELPRVYEALSTKLNTGRLV